MTRCEHFSLSLLPLTQSKAPDISHLGHFNSLLTHPIAQTPFPTQHSIIYSIQLLKQCSWNVSWINKHFCSKPLMASQLRQNKSQTPRCDLTALPANLTPHSPHALSSCSPTPSPLLQLPSSPDAPWTPSRAHLWTFTWLLSPPLGMLFLSLLL